MFQDRVRPVHHRLRAARGLRRGGAVLRSVSVCLSARAARVLPCFAWPVAVLSAFGGRGWIRFELAHFAAGTDPNLLGERVEPTGL